MAVNLYPYQEEALGKMKNGCILCGNVGSGKSMTGIAYYYIRQGGEVVGKFKRINKVKAKKLYIITTARKRETHEWDKDLAPFLLSTNTELSDVEVTVDSWNNIGKYSEIKDSFFIFDEQRVVGTGAWSKAFIKISRSNEWILLSATPGDCWLDYLSVFIANGFYRNKTQFEYEHVVYKRNSKFKQVDRYINTGRLIRLRNSILIEMDYRPPAEQIYETVYVQYPRILYKDTMSNRINLFTGEPIQNASELCMCLRKLINSDESRVEAVLDIFEKKSRVIIFYNFDFELEILRSVDFGYGVEVAEWNSHKHQEIPNSERWVYLVQYTAGAEGWNCIKTDTIIFFSQNYSYKIMTQAAGRINRLNTPYNTLHYYTLRSHASIDNAIALAITKKKKFNEGKFAG